MCSQMNCFLWANLVYELGHMILYVHVVSMILAHPLFGCHCEIFVVSPTIAEEIQTPPLMDP